MRRSTFTIGHFIRGCVATVLLSLVPQTASAIDVPWINFGSGFIPNGFSVVPGVLKDYSAEGFSIPVGKYSSEGNKAQTIVFDEPTLSGQFKGDFNFRNRFLGQLVTTFGDTGNGAAQAGTFTALDQGDGTIRIFFFAEFNPKETGSTGIFRNVTGGSLMMPAISEAFDPADIDDGVTPALEFSWVGFGHLEFGN
jgi:hypothetical protein